MHLGRFQDGNLDCLVAIGAGLVEDVGLSGTQANGLLLICYLFGYVMYVRCNLSCFFCFFDSLDYFLLTLFVASLHGF